MERYVAKLKKEARLPNHCYFCCGGQLARPDTFYNNSGSNPANVNNVKLVYAKSYFERTKINKKWRIQYKNNWTLSQLVLNFLIANCGIRTHGWRGRQRALTTTGQSPLNSDVGTQGGYRTTWNREVRRPFLNRSCVSIVG